MEHIWWQHSATVTRLHCLQSGSLLRQWISNCVTHPKLNIYNCEQSDVSEDFFKRVHIREARGINLSYINFWTASIMFHTGREQNNTPSLSFTCFLNSSILSGFSKKLEVPKDIRCIWLFLIAALALVNKHSWPNMKKNKKTKWDIHWLPAKERGLPIMGFKLKTRKVG